MKSHESLKLAAGEQNTSIIVEISDRMRGSGTWPSPSLVYKWTQQAECSTDSGSRNPVDVLKQYIESCIILGRPREYALAPLDHLEHQFQRIAITVPAEHKNKTKNDLQSELLMVVKETGDVVNAYHQAMSHPRIFRKDCDAIEQQVWEAVTELMTYLHSIREAAR